MTPAVRRAVLALSAIVAGCGGGGSGTADVGADPLAAVCGLAVPTSGNVVYVAAGSHAASAGCGRSTATACPTIEDGLAACRPEEKRCSVVVRHGIYAPTRTLVVRNAVDVYGSCRFDGEVDRHYRTMIRPNAAPGTPAILAQGITAKTTVSDLVVIGQDQTSHGAASLTMVVEDSPALVLTGNLLAGGRGADGQDGSAAAAAGTANPGTTGALAADAGAGAGGPTCAGNAVPGRGAGGHGATPRTTVEWIGGGLSRSNCTAVDVAGSAGEPAGGASAQRAAKGISGDPADGCHNFGSDPGDGRPGETGAEGACGTPSRPSPLTAGSFDGGSWVASRGDDGQPGGVGGGGGGGGGGGACVSPIASEQILIEGWIGGGGGGGGCGGGGSSAGEQGGASIPLVLVDSTPAIDAGQNAVVPGPGGRGGRALDARQGGAGAAGGTGNAQQSFSGAIGKSCPGTSAAGRPGGPGGGGSAGAAGHGGPSIGIAIVGTSATPAGLDSVYASQPGPPGAVGRGNTVEPGQTCATSASVDGAGGVSGLSVALYDYSKPVPTDTLAAGLPLDPGGILTSINGRYRLTLDPYDRLCLLDGNREVWCFDDTSPENTGDQLRMQTDGNLCLYTRGGAPHCSNTAVAGSYLVVQDDGHVQVTNGVTPSWSRP